MTVSVSPLGDETTNEEIELKELNDRLSSSNETDLLQVPSDAVREKDPP